MSGKNNTVTSSGNTARCVTPQHSGFSLIELMVSMVILLVVTSVVMRGLLQTSQTQGTIQNRTEMHSSVRNATELLQQEIGQAGRVSFPVSTTYTLAAAVPANPGISQTVALSSSSGSYAGIFTNEQIVVGAGASQETVTITAYNSSTHQITADFENLTGQVINAPVYVQGTFASGVIPTTKTDNGATNIGSTGSLLKLYGDVNGDGNMVYVEYNCDTVAGKLYRNTMAWDAAIKPTLTESMVLLSNIQPNPDGSSCFAYQQKTVGADTYVVDVAVTLTVQTQTPDPKTNLYQKETKALLNVSPRNVFEGWQLASAGITSRIEPIPSPVCLLAGGASC